MVCCFAAIPVGLLLHHLTDQLFKDGLKMSFFYFFWNVHINCLRIFNSSVNF